MGSRIIKAALAVLASLGLNSAPQAAKATGFWSMGTDHAWSEQELDRAFDLFKNLQAKHGDRFKLVVQDLHKEGTPMSNGAKTAQILIKVYVIPPDNQISDALKSVGMVFVREP